MSALKRFFVALLLVLFICCQFASTSQAWDDVLVQAANDFATGQATQAQRAMLLARNYEVNLLAMYGEIDDAIFQWVQKDFAEFSERIAKDVADEVGVAFTVQVSKSADYKAGTDSDYITGATNADQVKEMQAKYNQRFTEELESMGRKVEDGKNWVIDNDIDFMGDASKSTADDFLQMAEVNNAAYKRPGAARYEAYSRMKGEKTPNLKDTSDYLDEMQDMIHHREHMIAQNQDELSEIMKKYNVNDIRDLPTTATDYKKAMRLKSEIYKNQAIKGKYLERIADATDDLTSMLPSDVKLGNNLIGSSDLPSRAKVRSLIKNKMNPSLLHTMTDDILRQQLQAHVEVLAAVQHTNPEIALECQTSIQKYSNLLTPQQRADVIDSIRKGLGEDAAKDLANIMRGTAGGDPQMIFQKLMKNMLPEADYKKALKALEEGNLDDLPVSFKNFRKKIFNLTAAKRTALSNPSTADLVRKLESTLNLKDVNPDTRKLLGNLVDKLDSADDPKLLKNVFGEQLTGSYKKIKDLVPDGVKDALIKRLARKVPLKTLDGKFTSVELGDKGSGLGADAFIGVAMTLNEINNIIDRDLPPEEESRELQKAVVTNMPIVGDFLQSINNGVEAYYEGDYSKGAQSAAYLVIAVGGCVPGGQIPALIAGLGMATTQIGGMAYDAYWDKLLVESWIRSGEWDKEKGILLGIKDKNGKILPVNFDALVGKFNEKYEHDYDGMTIRDSIFYYAQKHVLNKNKTLETFEMALKNLYPEADLHAAVREPGKRGEGLIRAAIKLAGDGENIDRNIALGIYRKYKQVFDAYVKQAIRYLHTQANAEYQASHYIGEAREKRLALEKLGKELKVPLADRVQETFLTYWGMIKDIATTAVSIDSLTLKQQKTYENYLDEYTKIKAKIMMAKDMIVAMGVNPPAQWNLTGYIDIDKERAQEIYDAYYAAIMKAKKDALQIHKDQIGDDPKYSESNVCDGAMRKTLGAILVRKAHTQDLQKLYQRRASAARIDDLKVRIANATSISESVHVIQQHEFTTSELEIFSEAASGLDSRIKKLEREYKDALKKAEKDILLCFEKEVNKEEARKKAIKKYKEKIPELEKEEDWEGLLEILKEIKENKDFSKETQEELSVLIYKALSGLKAKKIAWLKGALQYLEKVRVLSSQEWKTIAKEIEDRRDQIEKICQDKCTGDCSSECWNKAQDYAKECIGSLEEDHKNEMDSLSTAVKEIEPKIEKLKEGGSDYALWFKDVDSFSKQYKIPSPYPDPVTARISYECKCCEEELENPDEITDSNIQVSLKGPSKTVEIGAIANITATVSGGVPPYDYQWDGANGNGSTATLTTASAGDWTVSLRVTDADGYSVTEDIIVIISPKKAALKGAEGDVFYGETATLNAEGMGFETPETPKTTAPVETSAPLDCSGENGDNPFCVDTSYEGTYTPTTSPEVEQAKREIEMQREAENRKRWEENKATWEKEKAEFEKAAMEEWERYAKSYESIHGERPEFPGFEGFTLPYSEFDYTAKYPEYEPLYTDLDEAPEPKPEPVKEEEIVSDYKFIWQAEPGLTFDPPTSTDPGTAVTYDRVGTVKVWCEILKNIEGTFQTVGECEQVEVEVKPPSFSIVYDRENGKARVGEKVKATVKARPSVESKLIDYRWLEPATSNRMELEQNASRIEFTVKDLNPVKLQVLARVPGYGDELGEANSSYTGTAFSMIAYMVQPPNLARTWDPVKKELVTIKKTQRGTGERITLKAELQGGQIPDGIRWNWTVNEGTSISNPSSQTPTVSRSESGQIAATVMAKDKNNRERGRAKVTVSVVELVPAPANYKSPEEKKKEQEELAKKQAAKKKAQQQVDAAKADAKKGKFDEAIEKAEEAEKTDPDNKEIKEEITKIKQQKQEIDNGLKDVDQLIADSEFNKAQKKLIPLKNKASYYPPVQKMEVALGDAWRAHDAAVRSAFGDVKVKTETRDYKQALEAIEKARKTLKLQPSELKDLAYQEDFLKPLVAKKEKARGLFKSSKEKFESGDYQGCIDDYMEGYKLTPNMWNINTDKTINKAEEIYRAAIAKKKELETTRSKGNVIAESVAKNAAAATPENMAYAKAFEGKWKGGGVTIVLKVDGIHVSGSYLHNKDRVESVLSKDGKTVVGQWFREGSNQAAGISHLKLSDDRKTLYGLWGYGDKEPTNKWTRARVGSIDEANVDSSKTSNTSNAIWNFENGNLDGWTKTGDAFNFQPTYGDNPTARNRGQASNHQGNYWIGAYEKRPSASHTAGDVQGDGPKGTLTSPEFTISSDSLSFLVGGGCDANVERVELLIDGNPVLKTTGKCHETMERKEWDVSNYINKKAQIRLVDDSSGGWGHINFDDLQGVSSSETPGQASSIKNGTDSLGISKSRFEPGEKMKLKFTASEDYLTNSWVGMFKADLPHDGMAKNNNHELTYKYLEGKQEGVFTFTAPTKEGEYDFRMFERTNGKEVVTIQFNVAVDKDVATLTLPKKVFEPGESIALKFTASKNYPAKSWVGMFKADLPHDGMSANNNRELAYFYLEQKEEGIFTFKAPTTEGDYDFRMFERSNGKEVATIQFNVSVDNDVATLTLPKKVFEPGEAIELQFTASEKYPAKSWVGMFKADLPHDGMVANNNRELSYKYLETKQDGTFTFKAPTKEGEYDFRMFERSNGKEVATIKFSVSVNKNAARMTLPKSMFAPGESMDLKFTASSNYPAKSWIGMFKADLPHDGMAANNNRELSYKYLEGKQDGTFTFTAPKNEGNYDFRMFERSNGKEVATVQFHVNVIK